MKNKKSNNKKKIMITLLVIGILAVFIGVSINKKTLTDCSKPFEVIYLKPSELSNADGILKGGMNRVVVIPELNQLNANSEALQCESFDYNSFLNSHKN